MKQIIITATIAEKEQNLKPHYHFCGSTVSVGAMSDILQTAQNQTLTFRALSVAHQLQLNGMIKNLCTPR